MQKKFYPLIGIRQRICFIVCLLFIDVELKKHAVIQVYVFRNLKGSNFSYFTSPYLVSKNEMIKIVKSRLVIHLSHIL